MNDLIKQYNNLTEEEKRILLIYKSQLSYFINNAENINDEIFICINASVLDKTKSLL